MKAAVQTAINQPLEIWDLSLTDLQYGQVLVKMQMAGICGAQLQECAGLKGAEHIPHLMGHEGVGMVIATGRGVKLDVAQRVVLSWIKGEGCDVHGGSYGCTQAEFVNGGPCHTWAEEVIVSENRCTPIPDDVPNELATILGCPLATALGVCENEAKLKMGESVLVVGCGGVGLCCIAAAKAMGAGILAAYDLHEKGDLAVPLGATFHGPDDDHKIADNQFDCIIETTGNAAVIADTLPMLGPAGRYIMVGQPGPMTCLMLHNSRHLFDGGKTIKATQGGQCLPEFDIPRWVCAWRIGALKIDGIVTHSYPLDQVNKALDMLRSGKAGRVVLTMP